MLSGRDIFNYWAGRWRSLAAWGAPLRMEIEVREYKGGATLGWAWAGRGECVVRLTGDLARDLGTALHELAHLAAPSYVHHERPWREMYARAAGEALTRDPSMIDLDVDKYALDDQVVHMVRHWLRCTGQDVVLRAIGVLPRE